MNCDCFGIQCKLYDAEYRFMTVLWANEPVNSTELTKLCKSELGWSRSTTFNLLRKLCERGLVNNMNSVVSSNISLEDVQEFESRALLARMFDGSVISLFETVMRDNAISDDELNTIRQIIG